VTLAAVSTSGSHTPRRAAGRGRLFVGALIAGVTALISIIDATRFYIGSAAGGRPVTWLSALASNAPSWILLGALAPFALALSRRVPLGGAHWARALAIHVAGALTFAVLHVAGMAVYLAVLRSSWGAMPVLLNKFSTALVVNMLTYAAIVGASFAFRFHREAQTRALAESQLQASLTEARLSALRGQLNPHFLFNTLNAISTMALKGEQENVVRTLGYLGELLRVSLDDDLPQEVPLSEELEILERYLDIQRTRFGDRLTIRQTIDPATLDAMVPSMMLQPLVENAIVHGVAPIPGPGEVRIRAARRDGSVLLEVTDSGVGFGATTEAQKGTGIGLANTRARLVQLYGDAYTMTLGNGDGEGGARVSVAIPYRIATDRGVPSAMGNMMR
jgi:two-component system, LytTR family, sensor kinase